MMVMIEAAPALVPHSAVVPGSSCRRVISQPSRLEAATTRTTPRVNSTQWRSTSSTIDSGTMLAIRQPTMPWASTKGGNGNATLAPHEATTMPAISGPSIRAAGAWIHSRKAAMPADRAISKAHCSADTSLDGKLLGKLLRLAVHAADRGQKLDRGGGKPC